MVTTGIVIQCTLTANVRDPLSAKLKLPFVTRFRQWWKVIKYLYTSAVLEYDFEALITYLSI